MTSDLTQLDNSQLSWLVHQKWKDKQSLLRWAKENNKDKMIKDIESEINLLKEIEQRLDRKV